MIKFKFNVFDALQRVNFTTYKARTTGLLGADIMRKLKEEDTNISIRTLNTICNILDMQPKDVIFYIESEEDIEQKNKI
jgi:putative transcriptional regulator